MSASSSIRGISTLAIPVQSSACIAPQFPGLYVPHGLDQGGGLYLCSIYDAWLFTTLWTLIVYAVFYLAAAGYAFLVQVGASASGESSSAIRANAASSADAMAGGDAHGPASRMGSSGTESGTAARTAVGAAAEEKNNVVGALTAVAAAGDRGVEGLVRGARRNWRITIVVGVAYVVVGGVEAVLAGGIVGAILGTVYEAGGYRLSTWVPLVWAVINVLFLLLSSFSIQERLL